MKTLTWDELADIYKEKTGGRAKIMKMTDIYNWAVKQEFIKVNEDSTLSLIPKEKNDNTI